MSLLFRYLNKEILGLWFLMLGAQAFVGLLDFGFGQTLQRRIAFAKAKCGVGPDTKLSREVENEICELLALARRVYTVTAAVVFVFVLVAGWLYFHSLQLRPETLAGLRWAWVIMSLGYAFNTWGFMVESSLNGLGDIGWTNLINTGAQVAMLAANYTVLGAGMGLNALALVWLAKGLGIRIFGWGVVKFRHAWVTTSVKSASRGTFFSMVLPAIHWWLALVGYFCVVGASQYLIARFLGASALPDYVATYAALAAAQGALVGVVSAGTPLFSQMLRAGEIAHVRETILTWTKYGLGGLAMAYGFMGVWGREMFQLWLGPGHFVGWIILAILSLSMLAEAHQGMLQAACVAAERLEFYKSVLLGGALSLTLSLVMIPRLGLVGAAIATYIGQAVTQHWVTPWYAMRVLEMRFIEDVQKVLLPSAVVGSAVLLAGLAIKAGSMDVRVGMSATVIVSVLVGILFYLRPLQAAIATLKATSLSSHRKATDKSVAV